jgi:hypothetical protein
MEELKMEVVFDANPDLVCAKARLVASSRDDSISHPQQTSNEDLNRSWLKGVYSLSELVEEFSRYQPHLPTTDFGGRNGLPFEASCLAMLSPASRSFPPKSDR